jgi:hypothetical protein
MSSLIPAANIEIAKGSQSKLQSETQTNNTISTKIQLNREDETNNNSDDEILNFNEIALICAGKKEKETNVEAQTRTEKNNFTQIYINTSKTTEKIGGLRKKRKFFQEVQQQQQQQQQISIRREVMTATTTTTTSSSSFTSKPQKNQKSVTKSVREKKNKNEKTGEEKRRSGVSRVSATNFRIPSTSTSSLVNKSHSLWTEKYAPVDEVHTHTNIQTFVFISLSLRSSLFIH